MTLDFIRQPIADGIHFSSVRDRKFKQNLFSVNLIVPLREETASQYALVPFVLRKGGADCPDFTQLNRRLEMLYGANLYADVRRVGETQVMNLAIGTVDNAYTIEGENVNLQAAELLVSLLTQPNIVDGAFPAHDVELEKRQLIDTIETEINDKRSYAIKQLERSMFKDEPFGVSRYGQVERIEKITPQSLYEAYKTLLKTCQMEILFTGCGDPVDVMEHVMAQLASLARDPQPVPDTVRVAQAGAVNEIDERLDVQQSKLVLGFRADVTRETVTAFRLMSAIYGGTPTSKLFMNVREKMSLCYYCAARFDRLKGIMIVDAGVEQHNRDVAQREILNQLERVRNGDFSDEDISNARLALSNSFRTLVDSTSMLESFFLTQIIDGEIVTPLEEVQALQNVTREQIIEAAKGTSLDTVYFLTGEEATA